MRGVDAYTHRFANRCVLETPGRRGRDRRSAPPKSTVVQAAVDLGDTPQTVSLRGELLLSLFFVTFTERQGCLPRWLRLPISGTATGTPCDHSTRTSVQCTVRRACDGRCVWPRPRAVRAGVDAPASGA